MRTGQGYTLTEFVLWTRRSIYALLVLGIVPAMLHQFAGFTWLTIPWGVVFMLGTTVALSAGFRTLQTYNRLQEAQQAWSSIVSSSRVWGGLCRDLVDDPVRARELVYRHFAWLAALRHQLRGARAWETTNKAYNIEYRRRYRIQEREESLQDAIARYVDAEDAADILNSRARALEALNLQSRETRRLLREGVLTPAAYADLQGVIGEFQRQQSLVERIKNLPYPRQHAFINSLFVRILCVVLPFGVIGEFARLGIADGTAQGSMIWLGVPVSVLISWMYMSLDRVGENTENPFEGGSNDVPITRICGEIEADLRDMLGEVEVAAACKQEADIAL